MYRKKAKEEREKKDAEKKKERRVRVHMHTIVQYVGLARPMADEMQAYSEHHPVKR